MAIPLGLARLIWSLHWVSPAFKKNAYKALNKAGEPPSFTFSTRFFGIDYTGNLNNNIEFSIFYYGAFEKPLLYFMRDTALKTKSISPHSSLCFCDVGSNIGQHSLFMSRFADAVHAFEPFESVSKKLENHIKSNNIPNISLHKTGLSDLTEKLPFYAPTGSNQGIGSFDEKTQSKGNKQLAKLSLHNGDDYFETHGIERVDLMKIDVEGFEKRTLTGLKGTLKRQRPILVCEVSYANEISFESLSDMRAKFPKDYVFYTFKQRKPNGKKDRRKESRAKRTGAYELTPIESWRNTGQDDIVACPKEKLDQLSLASK